MKMPQSSRRRVRIAAAGVLTLTACQVPMTTGHAQAPAPVAAFYDGFDGPAGHPPSARWRYDVGGGGWGNNEMQVYTDSPDNVRLDGAGNLEIVARGGPGGEITSARITTKGTVEFTSGRAEARIALPAGAGLHPAFWLLGADLDEVGWPEAGEIDVIETLNHAPEYHTGVHVPSDGPQRREQLTTSGPAPFPLAGQFHTYWVDREPGRVTTGIDDLTLYTVTPADLAPESRWVFDGPFFLLLNLAVGGSWPGPPDVSTPNPSTMLVDWVKVTPR
ncbi:glycoside hydrolase family 16 protein [Mycolicibacterium vaccae]|uniref:glycoside hydrolase family 16 protein n=1 Tax=Mycolicibacterium vaccae TaxID=1810 RepID=UPI003D02C391